MRARVHTRTHPQPYPPHPHTPTHTPPTHIIFILSVVVAKN